MMAGGIWPCLVLALAALQPALGAGSLPDPLADAKVLAASRPGLCVMRVVGDSMRPFFDDGAVVVVKSIPVEFLAPGMVIVYRNRFGETVTHRVVVKVDGGWRVKGESNTKPDSTLVTARNLIGLVYAVFCARPPPDSPSLSAVAVALAAPAR